MVTPIGEKDRFAYDDNGRPIAAEISPGVVASGYTVAARLKTASAAGFLETTRLYEDGAALICLFSPNARAVEVWSGKWQKQNLSVSSGYFNIVNPQYIGIIDRSFNDLDEVKSFLVSPSNIPLRSGYLDLSGQIPPHADAIADREFALGLQKTPSRFMKLRFDKTKIPTDEYSIAADIEFLLQMLHVYVFRIDAASKLILYTNTLHFQRPQLLPQSESQYLITMEWMQMAGRDATFSMFHFQKMLEALRGNAVKHDGSIRRSMDKTKIKNAWKLYNSWFNTKHVIDMRDAIGHTAEFYKSAEERAIHSGSRNFILEFMFTGNSFSINSRGKLLSIEISPETIERLDRVKNLVLEAFALLMVA